MSQKKASKRPVSRAAQAKPSPTRKLGRRLTPRQRRFVDEYLIDLNASAAARRSGYRGDPNTVGPRLLADVGISQQIAEAMKERERRTHITQDRVLKELARVAFSDLRRAFKEDGTLKLPHEMDDDTAASLAGIDTTAVNVGGADDPTTLTTKKVKVFGKVEALTLAMRHLGLLNDKLELSVPTVRVKDYTGRGG